MKRPWQGGIWWWPMLAVAVGLATMGTWYAVTREPYGIRVGAVWWAAAFVVLLAAAWLGDRSMPRRSLRWTRPDTVAVLSILAVAALFRLWRITEYPPPDMFGFEEFQTGGLAYNIARDWWNVSIEFPLTNLMPGISFRLFGPSSYSLRGPFVASSMIAPFLLYAALRRVVARPAAWAAAMLLAAARWATVAGRFADEIFFPVSIVALAAWLFVAALQSQRLLATFAWAALGADLFYAYSGYRVFPLIALAGAILLALAAWRRRHPALSGTTRHFALVAAVWGVLLCPGIATGWLGGTLFLEAFERHEQAWENADLMSRAATAAQRLRIGWEVFARVGDEWPTVNVPLEPMLDPLTAALTTLAVIVGAYRWRWDGRWLALSMVAVPFLAVGLIPANVNVSRYFVLLIPLFFVCGYLFDDIVRWAGRAGVWVVGGLVGLVVIINFHGLQRLVDSPVVQASFRHAENTVLAAINALPAGSTAILLTTEGSNALEASDYRWFTEHVRGGRPRWLKEALVEPLQQPGPVYWITQRQEEAELLPELTRLVCPHADARIVAAEHPEAVVGVSWVNETAGCVPPGEHGVRAAYRTIEPNGTAQVVEQVDPVLCAYTIPWWLVWRLQDGQLNTLAARWQGRLRGIDKGSYVVRLDVSGASGRLRVGEAEAGSESETNAWASAELEVSIGDEPLPLDVQITAQSRSSPRVRLFWKPPGGSLQLVPPRQLEPHPS